MFDTGRCQSWGVYVAGDWVSVARPNSTTWYRVPGDLEICIRFPSVRITTEGKSAGTTWTNTLCTIRGDQVDIITVDAPSNSDGEQNRNC